MTEPNPDAGAYLPPGVFPGPHGTDTLFLFPGEPLPRGWEYRYEGDRWWTRDSTRRDARVLSNTRAAEVRPAPPEEPTVMLPLTYAEAHAMLQYTRNRPPLSGLPSEEQVLDALAEADRK